MTDSRLATAATPTADRRLRRTPTRVAGILPIAAGTALVAVVSGAVAGIVSTDALGVVAIVLGGSALMARVAAGRRSHRRDGPSVG